MPVDIAHYLVGRRAEDRVTLLSEKLADGNRAALVFGESEGAEVFRIVEQLGSEWEVFESTPDQPAELLGASAATGARLKSRSWFL